MTFCTDGGEGTGGADDGAGEVVAPARARTYPSAHIRSQETDTDGERGAETGREKKIETGRQTHTSHIIASQTEGRGVKEAAS